MAEAAKSPRETATLTLKRSGKTVTYPAAYTTRELLAAQKAAGKDASQVPVFLIQRTCQFDGAQLTAGEIMDLPGSDYAQIVGALFADGEEGND